jgi:hypothetical protein
MSFSGYLLKFGTSTLPNKYFNWGGVKSTPDQRTEKEAFTNANNELVRSTYTKYRTKIEITLKPKLNNEQVEQIFKIMKSGLVNAVEQKYQINYYDDKEFKYKTGYFYMPDPTFPIVQIIEGNNPSIIYDSISISFIEY